MSTDGQQEINGLLFPEGVEVPENCWQRGETQSGDQFYIFTKEGHLSVAHQAGMESLHTDIVAHGVREYDDGSKIPWVAAKATVVIDGKTFEKIGSTDAPANSLEDMAATAETKATKRAIKWALDIRSAAEDSSGGSVKKTPSGGVEVNPPDEYQPQGPDAPTSDIGDTDGEW